MTISTEPIASGASAPARPTAMPTVKTKKNVPIASTTSLRFNGMEKFLPRSAFARSVRRAAPAPYVPSCLKTWTKATDSCSVTLSPASRKAVVRTLYALVIAWIAAYEVHVIAAPDLGVHGLFSKQVHLVALVVATLMCVLRATRAGD